MHKGDDGGAGAGPYVPADHADQAHEGNDQLEDGKDEEVGGVVLVGEDQAHGRVQRQGAEDDNGPGVGQALLRGQRVVLLRQGNRLRHQEVDVADQQAEEDDHVEAAYLAAGGHAGGDLDWI